MNVYILWTVHSRLEKMYFQWETVVALATDDVSPVSDTP
jgi:hypothetical protein